jgi:type I restriction enzyme S subunit
MATTISDIATVSYGYTEKASRVPIGPKFLRITDIQDDNVNWQGVPYCKIESSDKLRYSLKHNDIVFARTGATTGKSYLVVDPPEAVCASYLIRLRLTHQGVLPAYVSYFFQTKKYWDAISLGTTGSAQGGFNASKLASLELSLPLLPAQQRIVAILDEAFEGLALATANAEKNLKNADELLDSVSENLFKIAHVEGERVPLHDLIDRGWITSHLDGNHGSNYPRKEEFGQSGIPYISANCIENDRVMMARAKYLSAERAAVITKGVARPGDVLFAHNATVGPVAVLRCVVSEVILGTSLTYYRCNATKIIADYLAHYMRSPLFRRQYEAVMRQSVARQSG